MAVVLKDFGCHACNLAEHPRRQSYVVGEGELDADVMVIDHGPSASGDASGSALGDNGIRFLRDKLAEIGMPASVKFFYTFATKCANLADDCSAPEKTCFLACRGNLDQEIAAVKPKIILCLGAKTAEFVFGLKPMKDHRGQFKNIQIAGHNCELLITATPFYFIRHDKAAAELPLFLNDLKKIKLRFTSEAEAPAATTTAQLPEGKKADYRILRTMADWAAFKETALELARKNALPYGMTTDIETTGFAPYEKPNGKGGKQLLGIGFCLEEFSGVFLPTHPKYGLFPDTRLIMAELKDFLAKMTGVGAHNGNFDFTFLRFLDISCPGFDYDTMLALHVIDENQMFGLETQAQIHRPDLGQYWLEVEKYLDKSDDGDGYLEAPLELLAPYCMKDCDVTMTLRKYTWAKLNEEHFVPQRRVFQKITMPLLREVIEAQYNGMQVDMPYVEQLADKFKLMAESEETKINRILGMEINLKSPQQLAAVLYGKQMLPTLDSGKETKGVLQLRAIIAKTTLELPILKRNKGSNSPSTDEETLDLLETHMKGSTTAPLFQHILKYRECLKILSTYIGEPLAQLVDGKLKVGKGKGVKNNIDVHGRVHTTFKLAKTKTGRLASERPNMQNIPATSEMRKMFIARKGWKLIGGDFSQAELRIMAIESGDQGLQQAFLSGVDVHKAVASTLFNVPVEAVTKQQRQNTKAVNFGLIYGRGAKSLSEQMGIPLDDAMQFIDAYFRKFVNVKRWMDTTKRTAHELGQVRSLFGRVRHLLPEINDITRKNLMAEAERQAINFPIQSAASDCTAIVIARACRRVRAEGMQSQFILQVHDEIIFESPLAEAERMQAILTEEAAKPIQGITIPMVMDVKIMDTWAEKS